MTVWVFSRPLQESGDTSNTTDDPGFCRKPTDLKELYKFFQEDLRISSQGPYAVTVNWNNSLNNILCHYCGKKILNYHYLKILLILNWWTCLHSFVILYESKAERSLENLMNYYCLFWYYSNSTPWRSEVRNSVCLSVSTTIRLIRINFRRRNFEKTNQHRICGHKPT